MSRLSKLTLGGMALAAPIAANAQEHPNIVYIMTDQQSYYMISALSQQLKNGDPYASNPYVSTPNLDRLVRSGYSFADCYSAHPVSGPSRFALLTASSPNHYGMTGNFTPGGERGQQMKQDISERAMGTLFRNAGYQTFYAGKVHLPWANGNSGKGSIYEAPYYYGFDKYLTDDDREELAEVGSRFFSEYKGSDPFLLFISFMNPHDICMTQVLFNNKQLSDFKTDEIDRRARVNQINWRTTFREMDPKLFDSDTLAALPANLAPTDVFPYYKPKRQFEMDEHNMRVHIWFYYKLMEQVDQQIGSILDALDKSPYKDNTIIVFTSDHGEMACSHELTGKNYPYQECQKVPLIFAGKNIPQGYVDTSNTVCNGWDMLPTMLDLAGIDIPKEFNGISLKNTILDGKKVNRKYLYFETVNSYGVIDSGHYKFIRFGGITPSEGTDNEVLFDLEKDPGELHNMIADPAYKGKVKELRKALDKKMEEFDTSDEVFKKNK
ncbi:MAG: sulfatase [Candidatus Cryptobacteroides sp.]